MNNARNDTKAEIQSKHVKLFVWSFKESYSFKGGFCFVTREVKPCYSITLSTDFTVLYTTANMGKEHNLPFLSIT